MSEYYGYFYRPEMTTQCGGSCEESSEKNAANLSSQTEFLALDSIEDIETHINAKLKECPERPFLFAVIKNIDEIKFLVLNFEKISQQLKELKGPFCLIHPSGLEEKKKFSTMLQRIGMTDDDYDNYLFFKQIAEMLRDVIVRQIKDMEEIADLLEKREQGERQKHSTIGDPDDSEGGDDHVVI